MEALLNVVASRIKPSHSKKAVPTPTTTDSSPREIVPPSESAVGAKLDNRWYALGGGVLALAILYLAWPYQHWNFETRHSVLGGWFRSVISQEEWQFCLLVPFLAGFLIHLNRAKLRDLPLEGDWRGLALMIPGLGFFWMGYKVDTGYLGFLSAHLVLGGLIVLIAGRAWARALFTPWVLLAFMWPMFPLEEMLASPLRLLTANGAAKFLNLVGVNTVREGTSLFSAPDPAAGLMHGDRFRLNVEAPCSGIRSLFSLLMIAIFYGSMALRQPKQRLVLFLAAVPLAMLGNFVRMILLALGSMWFGSEFAVGRNIDGHQEMSGFHSLAGYAVFAVALSGMFAVCSFFEGRHWKRVKKSGKGTPAGAPSKVMIPKPRLTRAQVGASVAMATMGLGVCALTPIQIELAKPGLVRTLPLQFKDFQGMEQGMTMQEKSILAEGVKIVRNAYLGPGGRQITVTLITSGQGKRELHRPEVCLPGQGWNMAESTPVELKLSDGRTLTATLLRLFSDREISPGVPSRMRAVNLYWYVGSDGTTSPDYYDHIRISYLDAIFKTINHRWSMVSIFSPITDSQSADGNPFAEIGAIEEVKNFVQELAPHFMTKADGSPPEP